MQAAVVRTLQAQGELANFDADADFDGIRIYLQPSDGQGNRPAVEGMVSVELQAQRLGRHGEPTRYETVERWSQAISAADYSAGSAVLQLPFRSFNPNSAEYAPLGIISVRLGVASVGTFDAVIHDVPLRQLTITGATSVQNRFFLEAPHWYGRVQGTSPLPGRYLPRNFPPHR
jgi:hypothetical protein